MWNWLSNLFKTTKTSALPSVEPSEQSDLTDQFVEDEAYEFRVGTRPKLPAGLSEIQITKFPNGTLLLRQCHVDFTVDQTDFDDSPDKIARACRILRWAKTYHGLDAAPQPPVRLHNESLLVSSNGYHNGPETEITEWLRAMNWETVQNFHIQRAGTKRPLEDGYFTCLRIVVGEESETAADPRLSWERYEGSTTSVVTCLCDFIRAEMKRIDRNCEDFLRNCYSEAPEDQFLHPVFALLDFPSFDMGCLRMTFAGSVWSEGELRLWSRPSYFHK